MSAFAPLSTRRFLTSLALLVSATACTDSVEDDVVDELLASTVDAALPDAPTGTGDAGSQAAVVVETLDAQGDCKLSPGLAGSGSAVDFSASLQKAGSSTASCKLTFGLKVPAGYRPVLETSQGSGHVALHAGVTAELTGDVRFAHSPVPTSARAGRWYEGPAEQAFTFGAWSDPGPLVGGCGVSETLTANLTLKIKSAGESGVATSIIAVDRIASPSFRLLPCTR